MSQMIYFLNYSIPFVCSSSPYTTIAASCRQSEANSPPFCVSPYFIVFRLFRKITKSDWLGAPFCMPVSLSVRLHGTTELPLDGFWLSLVFGVLRKTVEKVQVSLEPDKNNGYFTWRHLYIYDNISLSSTKNEKSLAQNCRQNQNTHFTFGYIFPEIVSFLR
jgi:hypothetical protein